MNRSFVSIALILTACFIGVSQTTRIDKYVWEKKDDGNYGCKFTGDSGHYDAFEIGRVIKVTDSDTVVFESAEGRIWRVNLIGVNSDSNKKKAKTFLEENALNKEATLIYSPGQMDSKKLNGIIEISGKDINRRMLELGIVRYKDSKSYQLSRFNDCVFFRAEDKAKTERLGIWAK